MTLVYAEDQELSAEDFIDVMRRSGLAAERDLSDIQRVRRMLAGADIVVTARDASADGKVIGVARCVTDLASACFCSDLAVDGDYQGRGVGAKLLELARASAGPECRFFLIDAPAAPGFYERAGFEPVADIYADKARVPSPA